MAVVMGLVFGGLRVSAAANTAAGFGRTTQLAELGEQVTLLAQDLEDERDLTAAVDAAGGFDSQKTPVVSATELTALNKQLTQAQAVTDAEGARVTALAQVIGGSFPAIVQAKAAQVVSQINNFAGLRSESAGQPSLSAISNYNDTLADLFSLNDEITSGSGDPVLADGVRTLDAMSRAKDQASQQRAILYAALINGHFANGAQQALLTSQGVETEYLLAFQSSATNTELNDYLATVAGVPVDAGQLLNNYLGQGQNSVPSPSPSPTSGSGGASGSGKSGSTGKSGGTGTSGTGTSGSGGTTPSQVEADCAGTNATNSLSMQACELGTTFGSGAPLLYYNDMTDTIKRMRSVETRLGSVIVTRSQALEAGARQSAEFTAAVTGGVLLLVLLATILVARSLVEPLRRLQADALEVATVRLPERVAELSETTDPQAALQIEPISVNSTDEIGKVARAFDQVHREAVRLAGNEALLRGNLNAMFISLSRRSVPLIDRLARMIDSLEQNEDDPDRLSNLFSMDHLVTRMRRNSENLLVLAGEEPVRKWSEPVPLADVARAATSEIEQYSRVVLNIQPGIAVSGQAAADVVHLLAEIIENATMFSPRDTPVHVSGQELSSGGVLLEVRDSGVGVSPPRLAEMNWRLDNPPLIDVSVSRHMGLFAVSRLAARHGVRVRLRPVSPQGLSALVWLPGNLTGREAVRYPDRSQLVGQAAGGQLRMGGRRISGRHRHGLRGADDYPSIAAARASMDSGTPGMSGMSGMTSVASAPRTSGGATSNWFRPKRPSGMDQEAAASTVVPEPAGRASAMDNWSDNGWRVSEPAGSPVTGERTSAGLPTRIPRANLFRGSMSNGSMGTGGGSMGNGSMGTGPATGDMPAYGQPPASYEPPAASYEPESATFPLPTAPRRSADMARNRLSGFQLGNRDAQDRIPRAGEEASR